MDREICSKLVSIPNDILDTKEFQDGFRDVKETNTKIYLFINYAAQILSLAIQLFIPLLLLAKLSVFLILPCFVIAGVSIYSVTKIQIDYWSEYITNTTLRRKMGYFLGLFTGIGTLSITKAFHVEDAFFQILEKS